MDFILRFNQMLLDGLKSSEMDNVFRTNLFSMHLFLTSEELHKNLNIIQYLAWQAMIS